ncbi:putative tripartite motif-containing protein 64B, partial [Taenia solium]
MRDPHNLPCGHTFCLRPCLLSHAGAVTARCIHCQATYNVADLSPNFAIEMKLSLIARYRKPKVNSKQENNREHFEEHRHRLMLRTKLNDLSRHKTILMSLRSTSSTKNEIIGALDAAVKQMCLAADTTLDGALVKLKKVDGDCCKSLNELAQRITKLSTELRGTQGIHVTLNLIADMHNTLASRESLKQLTREATLLGDAIKNLSPLTITQMQVSDRITKV